MLERLRSLSREEWSRYGQRAGYILCFALTFLIVVFMGGETTAPVRAALGLDRLIARKSTTNKVFGDCSRPENRSDPHCQMSQKAATEREWKGIGHRESGKASLFSLW